MPVADKIKDSLAHSSMIRKMFEAGAQMRAEKGAENVFDFSLGNPNLEPPPAFKRALLKLLADPAPGRHAYMPNAGIPSTRADIAAYLRRQFGYGFTAEHIIMTVAAGGALNVILKTLTNPGSELIVPMPYFVEYDAYIENHGGKVRRVATERDFTLNLDAIAEACNENTIGILINTPNNPTGVVYSPRDLEKLGRLLEELSAGQGRALYLICDEPYRQLVYDGREAGNVFACYPNTVVATSFSKNLSLPGERIGYIALHPQAADSELLLAGMILCNRILGYVNAPALMQRAVAMLLEEKADIAQYEKKRDLMCQVLDEAGFSYVKPGGAFYVFPRCPIDDDVAFAAAAIQENILLVPGSGFMGPKHFRLAFCCADETITRSLPAFKRLRARYR
ncbi:MAG: pyridoxal phosphate-dependent aminotransferase [Desulfarculales bacterium]|jgi:aspartate aminotransferase|nr:pyridoxal phosphate-dependent aminotransferase [Desulfarculales bacterium]